MDLALVIAGALLATWPLTYRRTMRNIEARISSRGGDVDQFKQTMDRRWIRGAMLLAPLAGAIVVVLGIVDY